MAHELHRVLYGKATANCCAKHAIRGFTDSLRSELLHDKINVHLTMVQLPALNTPQFEWVKSRLPRQPQPVPPIFQPEVAARGIYWAAYHRRRELDIGFIQLWTTTHRVWLAGAGLTITVGGACLLYKMMRWSLMRSSSGLARTA